MTDDASVARPGGGPVARFLHVEVASGFLLLGAAGVAVIWASSPWSAAYGDLWHAGARLELGPVRIGHDLRSWVNDGLMTLFFFVVGLEIKRELVAGQLSERRIAALPVAAAVGGMVVPALLYTAMNLGGDGGDGWGIPMATDIAFALGVLALLGDRVPRSLRVLLLSLAIVDDLGAIVVIAVFYTESVQWTWLLAAAAGLVAVGVLRRRWSSALFVVLAVAVWACTLESGVHATIAGVALGLLVPSRAAGGIEARLHPWTSFLVLPLFALANAGIELSSAALRDAASSTITLGVVTGLVLGKLAGIVGFARLAVRLGWARLPDDLRGRHLVGMAALGGIGFTVSIFVTGLAFDDPARQGEAKVGVLVASVLAAAVGAGVLVTRSKPL